MQVSLKSQKGRISTSLSQNKAIFICLALLSLFLNPASSFAEIRQNLNDQYLQAQCDWAMYLDVQDMKQSFKGPNSKLQPLSRVRISYRSFPRTKTSPLKLQKESREYEQLWYHYRTPVGSRRYIEPQFPEESLGMIVLGPCDGKNKHAEQLTNALLRLMIDLQFKKASTSIVLVPENNYNEIAACLNYYNFWADYKLNTGKRMNIHLCSSTSSKDEIFYLGK